MNLIVPLFIIAAIVTFASACTASTPTSTPTTTLSSTPAGPAVSQFADSGKTVFARRCSICHGDQGQGGSGPVVIGASADLIKYKTAQGLLDYIDGAMPANAPGSLSQQEYQQVLAFLMVQNNYTTASTTFDTNKLTDLPLSK